MSLVALTTVVPGYLDCCHVRIRTVLDDLDACDVHDCRDDCGVGQVQEGLDDCGIHDVHDGLGDCVGYGLDGVKTVHNSVMSVMSEMKLV